MRSNTQTIAIGATRPQHDILDVIALLFRELGLMILVFLLVFLIGAAAVVVVMKKTYTAHASLYAGTGQEYVYQPRVGGLADMPAQPPSVQEVAQNEAAIVGSREVALRAVRAVGVTTFQTKPSTDPMAKQEADALRTVSSALEVGVSPMSPVVSLSYESRNAETSAKVLNAIIDAYLAYRREVFQDGSSAAIDRQRAVFEDELGEVDDSYQRFLESNEIGDFATAKLTAGATYQATYTQMLAVRAQLNQANRRVAALQSQQTGMPAEVALQQDLNVAAQDQIRTLRTEREQLLARYTPDSQPVRDKEAQIAQMEDYVNGEDTVGVKEVRLGPNPVWVELETNRINAVAERDALAGQLAVLEEQVGNLRDRMGRLTQLESENAILAGNREILTASIREFQQRGARNRADNELVRDGADNVRVISRAAPPSKGSSLKLPLLALVFLFAGFTALCVGLLRVFTRRGFVTPASAGRTLGVPVLAVAPMKA